MPDYFVGLDLGQSQDYTALSVLERHDAVLAQLKKEIAETPVIYHVRHLERFSLGTPYPTIVERVTRLMNTPPLKFAASEGDCGFDTGEKDGGKDDEKEDENEVKLVVDATGVGAPVVDLLRQAELEPAAVTITGGETMSRRGWDYRVPKRDLVGVLQVLFQAGRLKVAEALPEAATLVKELLAFKVKITINANDTYGAWREGVHDDLVLAVALPAWYGERGQSALSGFDEDEAEEANESPTSASLLRSLTGRSPRHI